MVGDHREIPFWLLKKSACILPISLQYSALRQSVSHQSVCHSLPSNKSINQSTNQLFLHFCSILDTLGALRHDGKRKGAELALRHFSWYYIFSSPVVRRNNGNKFIRAFLHSSSQSINQSINHFYSFFIHFSIAHTSGALWHNLIKGWMFY